VSKGGFVAYGEPTRDIENTSDPMLLIMCRANVNRYAIDSRHVSEVLPRVVLHPLAQSAPWLAGLLIHRGSATPVVDLVQLAAGSPCANRLSSRIVILQTELRGIVRRVGVLAEQVGIRECDDVTGQSHDHASGSTALGTLFLDEQGPFELVDIPRLLSEDRQAFLFPAAERGP
jgi:chemotaxis-related protein WspB